VLGREGSGSTKVSNEQEKKEKPRGSVEKSNRGNSGGKLNTRNGRGGNGRKNTGKKEKPEERQVICASSGEGRGSFDSACVKRKKGRTTWWLIEPEKSKGNADIVFQEGTENNQRERGRRKKR